MSGSRHYHRDDQLLVSAADLAKYDASQRRRVEAHLADMCTAVGDDIWYGGGYSAIMADLRLCDDCVYRGMVDTTGGMFLSRRRCPWRPGSLRCLDARRKGQEVEDRSVRRSVVLPHRLMYTFDEATERLVFSEDLGPVPLVRDEWTGELVPSADLLA